MCCAPGFAPGARSLFLAASRLCALGGGDDLLVEKVIDYQRRGREGATDGVVAAHVGQALGGGEGADLLVQRRPVTAVAAGVDGLVEGRERGIARGDIVEDGLFVAAAQVEVLQPCLLYTSWAPFLAQNGRLTQFALHIFQNML